VVSDQRRGVDRAGGQHRQHPVDVADHVGMTTPQRQPLIHTNPMCTWQGSAKTPIATTVPALRVSGPPRRARRMADRVDRGVDATALVALRTTSRGLCSVRWTGPRRTASDLEAGLDRVDGEHRPGSGGQRDLDRAQADGPSPSTATGRRMHPGGCDRVVAGAHHVAGEQSDVVRETGGTLRSVMLAIGTTAWSAWCPEGTEKLPVSETRIRSHLW